MADEIFVPPPIPPNYYKRLGPKAFPGCRDEDIDAAFRDQVKIYHPDRSGWDSKEWYEAIIEAHDQLDNQAGRDAYDDKLVMGGMDGGSFFVVDDAAGGEDDEDDDCGGSPAFTAPTVVLPQTWPPVNPVGYFNEPLEATDKALAILGAAIGSAIGIVALIYLHGTIQFVVGVDHAVRAMAAWPLPVWIVVGGIIGGLVWGMTQSPFGSYLLNAAVQGSKVAGELSLRLFAIYLKLTFWLLRYIVLKIMAQGTTNSPGP